jgi:hypothetical protein
MLCRGQLSEYCSDRDEETQMALAGTGREWNAYGMLKEYHAIALASNKNSGNTHSGTVQLQLLQTRGDALLYWLLPPAFLVPPVCGLLQLHRNAHQSCFALNETRLLLTARCLSIPHMACVGNSPETVKDHWS